MTDVWRTQGFMSFAPVGLGQGFGQGEPPPRAPSAAAAVQSDSPPSSYAVASLLDGDDGAWLRLAGLTVLRGVFIIPGLWIAAYLLKIDLDTNQLLGLSFGGSATITGGMIAYYAIRRATQ